MIIEAWIDGDLITLDTEDVWRETFAHWDCLTDTDRAIDIANATVEALLKEPLEPDFSHRDLSGSPIHPDCQD